MGKGDIKTKKGKISNGTFGKLRPARTKKVTPVAAAPAKKPAKKAAPKA